MSENCVVGIFEAFPPVKPIPTTHPQLPGLRPVWGWGRVGGNAIFCPVARLALREGFCEWAVAWDLTSAVKISEPSLSKPPGLNSMD